MNRKRMIGRVAALVLTLACQPLWQANAAIPNTEHTLKLAEGETSPAAAVADMAWLAGRWVGEGLGGSCEEHWGPPQDDRMLGTFTLSEKGKPVFHELMLVAIIDGRLTVRLKHFNPDLTGWEEKDKFVDFRFVEKRGGTMYFSGLTYMPDGADGLKVYVAFRNKDGKAHEELFSFRRQR